MLVFAGFIGRGVWKVLGWGCWYGVGVPYGWFGLVDLDLVLMVLELEAEDDTLSSS